MEQLYDSHASGLFRYAFGIVRDEHSGRDILQEVFIKLARLPQLEVINEKAWLYRMAHNLAIDQLRRARTRSDHAASSAAEEDHAQPADPDSRLITNELARAMNELPPEQRSVAQLRLREDMTFEQIAEVQGIPINTAASRYRYALEKLRTALRPIYDELQ